MKKPKPIKTKKGWTRIDLQQLGILPEQQIRVLKDLQNFQKNVTIRLQPFTEIAKTQAFQDILKLQKQVDAISKLLAPIKVFPYRPVVVPTVNSLIKLNKKTASVRKNTTKTVDELIEKLEKETKKFEDENKIYNEQNEKYKQEVENFKTEVNNFTSENNRLTTSNNGFTTRISELEIQVKDAWQNPNNWGTSVIFGLVAGFAIYLITTALSSTNNDLPVEELPIQNATGLLISFLM